MNNQTVVGWQLKKLVAALRENSKEVRLLLKRRPCHTDPYSTLQRKRKPKQSRTANELPALLKRLSRKGTRKNAPNELINTEPTEYDKKYVHLCCFGQNKHIFCA